LQSKDPFLRMSIRLQNYLVQNSSASRRSLESVTKDLLDYVQRLQHQMELSCHARSHGWIAATARMEESARHELTHLNRAVQQAIAEGAVQSPALQPTVQPTLRELRDDLRQLDQEFEQIKLDLRNRTISVVTEPIELEDIFLGDFEIRLDLRKLSDTSDASAFEIIAQDPHPSAVNESVTHPHVQDEKLCAGDASVSISTSLRSGRLCDAFLAVNSVLHTYNRHSPYVALGDWSGVACDDCGSIMSDDESYFCEGCDQDYCGDCIRSCGCCDNSRCRNCLEEDPVSGALCCSHCQETCAECGRMVAADSYDKDSELCPGCLEKRQEQERDEQIESEGRNQTQELENNHEQHECNSGEYGGQNVGDQGGTRAAEAGNEFTSATAEGAG
jgi:hypothetical protein